MKRSEVICLAMTVALILSACGGEKEVKKDETKKEPSQVTAKKETTKAPEKPAPTQTTSPKTYTRPASVKTVALDTTAQKPKTPVLTAKPATVTPTPVVTESKTTPDSVASVNSPATQPIAAEKGVPQETQPAMKSVPPVPTSATQPESTAVVRQISRLVEAEVPATALGSLLFDDVFFDANETATPSLTFNSNYLITLSKVVKALKVDPKINVRLVGHTMKAGTVEKDKEISLKRAISIGKLILDLFPADEKESIAYRIEIIPAGSDELLIEGDNRVKEMLNRRVSIELFDGNLNGSTLADFIYRGKETKFTVVSSAPKKVEKPAPEVAPAVSKVTGSKASTQDVLYNNGQKLYNQKKYEEAISIFEELVSLNPKNSLADNAQWWIGECHYSQGDYVDALNAFQKVSELGDKNKAAYAQLRMGYCYTRLNQNDMAKGAWEKVIRDFPNATEEVAKAKKALQIAGVK